ncbi:diaminopimelate epimerase [Arenibacter sp. F26102]|uniref:diaminopimelate epimerase n=1 Tax=Arenibacter sp. F26102 TaxID=2926416 RepID=UPI001FF5E368|nr:diaminopimelate epimerase [Arenibacter sp. F26102]MCK0147754.1 diaminopimelate epimerase [Arenibacter sp. F26102]
MLLNFYKYQGTGNDFVMIDNRQDVFPKDNVKLVSFLCDRRFGIGADGLILLENDETTDFKMVYYNSDGRQSTMCGNGGRCIVAFANYLGIVDKNTSFMAVDGLHNATIENGIVGLEMQNVNEIKEKANSLFLNTGSPHHVQLVEGLKDFDVRKEGEKLRYGLYGEQGSNINFVGQASEDTFNVRTYERGVEDETLSCGTGVTAVALAMNHSGKTKSNIVKIVTPGGNLEVKFQNNENGYDNIWLTGPAQLVFKGGIDVES